MIILKKEDDAPYLSKTQWKKIFIAFSILTVLLYIGAMITSLCGSSYFILNYQNAQMDKIESFLTQYKLIDILNHLFATIEFTIILAFILKKLPKWYYVLSYFGIPLILFYSLGGLSGTVQTILPFLFYLIIPVIEQCIDNHKSDYHEKFSFKKYLFCMLRLLIATGISFLLQFIIYCIKTGSFSVENHIPPLSTTVIYAIEYDITLLVLLYTLALLLNREKGDSKLCTQVGGFSQTSTKQSQTSLLKNLTKTQKSKLVWFYIRLYVTQIIGFTLLMVLPFLLGKVLEFLVMYLSFAVARAILGFNYSLHYKKETLCITVGIIVFGILSLAVPFFYVVMIIAIVLGISLAILLHLSYKYKAFELFNKVAKPDKFATLYVYFDGNLEEHYVKKMCRYKQLTEEQVQLIYLYTQGNKISYIAWKLNYSQRMTIYKLDEAIDKLIA